MLFMYKKTARVIKGSTGPAEGAEPIEAQSLSINPCRAAILTRHLWGGRIEDACGEVTGHPIGIETIFDLCGVGWLAGLAL